MTTTAKRRIRLGYWERLPRWREPLIEHWIATITSGRVIPGRFKTADDALLAAYATTLRDALRAEAF